MVVLVQVGLSEGSPKQEASYRTASSNNGRTSSKKNRKENTRKVRGVGRLCSLLSETEISVSGSDLIFERIRFGYDIVNGTIRVYQKGCRGGRNYGQFGLDSDSLQEDLTMYLKNQTGRSD